MSYPWRESLSSWAASTGLHVDALGLVTILGSEEVNNSVGRLVSGSYVEYLPLLGAFMLASDRFTEKRAGFMLYNFTAGIQTSELAGWFSRWLKAQEFSQVRDIVTWQVERQPKRKRWHSFWIGFLLIGVPVNGMLVALTVLSEDWWGFANAVAMVLSVFVRVFLVAQRQAGIDKTIADAMEEAIRAYKRKEARYHQDLKESPHLASRMTQPVHPNENIAKVIVVMDDSKVVTIRAPEYLIGRVFTKNPPIPRPALYIVARGLGWLAFGSHIVTLGMAGLHTQIFTAALLVIATILSVYKVGCDDWRLRKRSSQSSAPRCWVSNTLAARCFQYPKEYAEWMDLPDSPRQTWDSSSPGRGSDLSSLEKGEVSRGQSQKKRVTSERRQDLYVWLRPNDKQLQLMRDWYLIPFRNEDWMAVFEAKMKEHGERHEMVIIGNN